MNFSKGLLERFSLNYPSRLTVLPVRGVQWSDWGSEQRVLSALEHMFPWKSVAESRLAPYKKKGLRFQHELHMIMGRKGKEKGEKPANNSGESTLGGETLHRRIAERAYEHYEQRGYVHGYDLDDWLEAERFVLGETRSQAQSKAKKPRSRSYRSKEGQKS